MTRIIEICFFTLCFAFFKYLGINWWQTLIAVALIIVAMIIGNVEGSINGK